MTKTEQILSTLSTYENCENFCQGKNPRRIDKNTIVKVNPIAAEIVHHGTTIIALHKDSLTMFKAWPSQCTIRRQNAILGKHLHIKQWIIYYNNRPLCYHSWYSLDELR